MSIIEFEYKPGFPALRLTHPNGSASAEILLYGGHLISWIVDHQSLIFLSDKAIFEQGKAIRGGVPLVWPQFGPGPLAQHGFARVKVWSLGEKKVEGDPSVQLHLFHDDETMKVWPNKFQLTLTVRLTEKMLYQELVVRNSDNQPFNFTTLFHTYFNVNNIAATQISGLNKATYIDKVDAGQVKVEENSTVQFTGETDRVYKDGAKNGNPLIINDTIQVKGSSSMADAVIWNPWQNKAKASADIGEENYPKFVCVEIGHVWEPVKLESGQTWVGFQELTLLK